MYKYLASAWVAAPAEEVFAFYGDPGNWQPTLPSLLAVEMLTDPPFGLGARWRQRRRFLWMAQDSAAEVVGYEPPRTLECRIEVPKLAEMGGSLEVAHCMEEDGAGTRWIVGACLTIPQPRPRLVERTLYPPSRLSGRPALPALHARHGWSEGRVDGRGRGGAGRDLAAFKRAIERGRKAEPSS